MPSDKSVIQGRLNNGFNYYIKPYKGEPGRAAMYLVSKTGSMVETKNESGYSRLLSHLSLNKTQHFSKEDIQYLFLKTGSKSDGSDVVFNGYDKTIYKFQLASYTPLLRNTMEWLKEVITPSTPAANLLQAQRDSAIKQIKESGILFPQRIIEQLRPIQLGYSAFAEHPPIGSMAAMEKLSASGLETFQKKWLRPDLQALIIVGDIDVTEMKKQIEAAFASLPVTEGNPGNTSFFITPHQTPGFVLVTDTAVRETTLTLAVQYPEVDVINAGDLRNKLVWEIFQQAMSNALTILATKNKNTKATFLIRRAERGLDLVMLNIAANENDLEENFKTVYYQLVQISRNGFSDTTVAAIKAKMLQDAKQLFAARSRLYARYYADQLCNKFLYNIPDLPVELLYEQQQQLIGTISAKDITTSLQEFIQGVKHCFIVAPQQHRMNMPVQSDIVHWITTASNKK
ncbi:M16 family metallopeptidase [Pseudoflavitalea rhizosphaerae]|uniref:M16 family metallopeptidase n=1 Tax=Pseudoflavitalea rhizosphaerae TaxID=1884793 RepID=UPI0013E0AF29|nr:insulinase family protein [Pseudoflavitalea rhizosphaerae]